MTYKEFIENIISTRGRHGCGDEYHEKHHIVPRCLGGEDKEENYIDLFAREHYKAHKLLALENPHESKLQYAWWMMCNCTNSQNNKREKVSAEDYEIAKERQAKLLSKARRGSTTPLEVRKKISESNKGKIVSEETKQKMRDNHADYSNGKHPMYGKHHSKESIEHMKEGQSHRSEQWHERQSEAHKGQTHSQEWKDKMSEKNKGKNNPNYGNHKLKGHTLNARKVECEGIIFLSLADMAKYYHMSEGNFSSFLNGKKKMPQKWKDRGLRWVEGDGNN